MSRSGRSIQPQLRSLAHRLTAALAVAALLVPGAVAARGGQPILAADDVRFQVEDGQRWRLTVSGPGGFYARADLDGETRGLSLAGRDGSPPADGSYVWELRRLDARPGGRSAVRSGTLHVRDGRPLQPAGPAAEATAVEPPGTGSPTPLAPTHVGDVSIDGQLCVGGNCDEFVPLPIEAIKMYQDNPWLLATDSSDEMAVDPFPSNDWQIRFNDSVRLSVGGADYFGIEDKGDTGTGSTIPLRVDAGAPANSLRIDQNGNVGIGTATPSVALEVMGDVVVTGDFTASSSREMKHAFAAVEPRRVLELLLDLPVTEWSFLGDPSTVRHIGPVAEEFSSAFGLGRDGRHVSPVDLSGVAFAAIQGLAEVVRLRDAEIAELRDSRDELEARLAALESLVATGGSPAAP